MGEQANMDTNVRPKEERSAAYTSREHHREYCIKIIKISSTVNLVKKNHFWWYKI